MREIKFKFVYRYAEANITHITRPYTLDELVSNEKVITTEEIADELLMCDCKPEGESLYPECNCDEIFDHFKLIDRIEWSGILDKNGVEIYEGDIIKLRDTNLKKDVYAVVVYDDIMARYVIDHMKRTMDLCDVQDFTNEGVVGNRFQHPELLNAK